MDTLKFIEFIEKRNSPRYVLATLNVLFLIVLTHYCYTWTVEKYSLSETNLGEQTFTFITSGYFLIPFLMFILIYMLTDFLGTLVTNIYAGKILKVTKTIKAGMLEEESFMRTFWLRRTTELLSRDKLSRKAFWNRPAHLVEEECHKGIRFILAFWNSSPRALICMTIVFFSVEQFSWILFTLSLIVFVLAFSFMYLLFFILDLMPFFVEQYQQTAAKLTETVTPK